MALIDRCLMIPSPPEKPRNAAGDKEANTAKECNAKFRGHDQRATDRFIEMTRSMRFL
jgi:hypothetical protein